MSITVQKTSLHYGIWPWRRVLNGACISISILPENIAWQTDRPEARGPLKSGAWGGRPTCHTQTPPLPPSYFSQRSYALEAADTMHCTGIIIIMQCDPASTIRHGVAVYTFSHVYVCMLLLWAVLLTHADKSAIDVYGVQFRFMETEPKRLGAWNWQGHVCGNRFSIFLAYIHLL
jgi:hypothetical protein